jgi:hypothetical protein
MYWNKRWNVWLTIVKIEEYSFHIYKELAKQCQVLTIHLKNIINVCVAEERDNQQTLEVTASTSQIE